MYIMKKQSFSICIVAIFFVTVLNFSPASARDLIISMAQLPKILESPDEGIFVDMVKAMDNVYDGKIERKVFPFARSIDNVIKGEADFHLPMIRNTIVPESSLPYAFSTDKTGDVCFIIYSHKDNPVTLDTIKDAKTQQTFPLKIESQLGFRDYFDFPITDSTTIENSLKKISVKRIDAFIFAQEESDFVVNQLKLKDIHRELYQTFDDVFVIPKGPKGKEIDAVLSGCIKKLSSTGELKKLHDMIHPPYQKWQPYEMGW